MTTVLIPEQTTLMDPTSSTITYVGRANAGSATSAAVWQISKLMFDGSGNLLSQTWANASGNYDQVWNNRASLVYS